jgi:hypothetical protein
MDKKDIKAYKLSKLFILMHLYINKDKEEWKIIKDFENYEISDYGRLKKNYQKYFKIIKPNKHRNNYYRYNLWKNSKSVSKLCHTLVMFSFEVPNPENKDTIDHVNRIGIDNRLINLRYATRKEQAQNRRTVPKNITETIGTRAIWKLDIKTGKRLEKFISAVKAAEHIKIIKKLEDTKLTTIRSKINGVCNKVKHYNSSYGYKWEFDNEDDNLYEDEEWKKINRENILIYYPNMIDEKLDKIETYEISNYGRLKNKTGKINKGAVALDGYVEFGLGKVDKHTICFKGNVLTAIMFVENDEPLKKKVVNHIDGIKNNNYYKNLEWTTQSENVIHAMDNGLLNIKKKVIQYDLEGNKIEEFKSLNEAQDKLNINRRQIGYVANGKKENINGFVFKYVV